MRIPAAILGLLIGASTCLAQSEPDPDIELGELTTRFHQVGLVVTAGAQPCRGLIAPVPVPIDWPEQRVRIVDEDVTPSVRQLSYRSLEGTVRQAVVRIPLLQPGERAHALITIEVRRRSILPPKNPSQYELPQRPKRDISRYLAASPFIETRNFKIKKVAGEVGKPHAQAWTKVEAIYDWVRENVEYRNGPLKGAAAALRDGNGDCEELTSLFIAICRLNKIPARTVWVPGHCYPEFYLVNAEGKGRWFPCQAAGDRAFGEMDEPRPILQKGDNFRVPEKRGAQRYVSEFLTGSGGSPRVKWVRQEVGG